MKYKLLGGFPQNWLRGKELAKIRVLVMSIGHVPNALNVTQIPKFKHVGGAASRFSDKNSKV